MPSYRGDRRPNHTILEKMASPLGRSYIYVRLTSAKQVTLFFDWTINIVMGLKMTPKLRNIVLYLASGTTQT